MLPKEISRTELVEMMKSFTAALDVRCEHCHATKPGVDPASGRLEDLDFPSDAKETKKNARLMLRMVRAINSDHLAKLPGETKLTVTCATCHHGLPRPEPIEAIVERMLGESAEAAVAKYRELRELHYGSAAYDFSEWPLDTLGRKLLEGGAAGQAVVVLRLNADFHVNSGWLVYLLGEAELANGNPAAAQVAFARAVELDPKNQRALQRLGELVKDALQP